MNWFAAKYGATMLAAPIRGGFDNVAWITPYAVFLLATAGDGHFDRTSGSGGRWRHACRRQAAATMPDGDAMRERIRRETEY